MSQGGAGTDQPLVEALTDRELEIELFSLASRYGYVAHSRWFQDMVGQTLTAAAAGLSPGVLRAAREHGTALDLRGSPLPDMNRAMPQVGPWTFFPLANPGGVFSWWARSRPRGVRAGGSG